MGPGDRRERERQEVRRKILDAARELFATQGYEAVTMRQIAEKIEYTPTAIYFHFQDKEQLMNELCSIDFLDLAFEMNRLGADVRDPIARLRLIGGAYAQFGLTHPNHYRLLFMTPRPDPTPEDVAIRKGDPAQDAYAFLRATVIEVIATGNLRKEFRDPELVSQLLWASVHGVVSLHIAQCNNRWLAWRPADELVSAMFDITVRGMLREGVPLPAAPPAPAPVAKKARPIAMKKGGRRG